MGQGFQFCFGVLGPDFRGIGDVDHLRLDHVLVGVKFQGLQDQIGGQFAVFCFHGQDFVSSGLNGSGLMDIDMSGDSGDDGLVGTEGGGNGDEIGLGAACDDVDVCIGLFDFTSDKVNGVGCMDILTVAGILGQVSFHHGFQDAGMRSLAVVVGKAVHSVCLLIFR